MSRPKRGDVMKHITRARLALVIIAVAAGVLAATAAARTDTAAAPKPIVIGAVVDLTKNMAPFDAPALLAAQIEIKKINATGGVDGRPLKLDVPERPARPDADEAVRRADAAARRSTSAGSPATSTTRRPAAQQFLNAGKLLPSRRASAPTSWARSASARRASSASPSATPRRTRARRRPSSPTRRRAGRRRSSSPTTCSATSRTSARRSPIRFKQLGGKIVAQESFTQGDKTINNVVSRVNGEKSDAIAFCTSFGGDQPAFVSGLRSLGNNTPIINGWASDGELLVAEEPEGHELLLPHLRVGAGGDDPVRAGARVRGEDEGGRPSGADRRLPRRRRRDRRDRLRDQEGGRHHRTARSSPRIMVKFHKLQTLRGPSASAPTLHTRVRSRVPRDRDREQQREVRQARHGILAGEHRPLARRVAEQESQRRRPPGLAPGGRRLPLVRGRAGARRRRPRARAERGRRPDRPERRRQDDARQPPHRLRLSDDRARRARGARRHALVAAAARPGRARAHVPARARLQRADGARERRGRGARRRRVRARGARARAARCSARSGSTARADETGRGAAARRRAQARRRARARDRAALRADGRAGRRAAPRRRCPASPPSCAPCATSTAPACC